MNRRTALGLALGFAVAPSQAQSAIKTWRHYANCRFGQIHITSAAPADASIRLKTPVVCLHQSPRSGDYFKEIRSLLAQDRLVICPDTPGFGGSDRPPTKPDMEDLGGAIAEAMVDLGYGAGGKGAIDWLAYHTGTFVLTEAVTQRPDLARRLVMPGIPYFPPEQRPAKLKEFAQPRPYFTDPEFVGRAFKNEVLNGTAAIPIERRFEFLVERLRAGQESWWGFDSVFRYDADAGLKRITHPVLVPILSERATEETRKAAKLISNAKTVEATDLDGLSWHTNPGRMVAIIKPFLDT